MPNLIQKMTHGESVMSFASLATASISVSDSIFDSSWLIYYSGASDHITGMSFLVKLFPNLPNL